MDYKSRQGIQAVYGIVGVIVGSAFMFGSRIQSLEQITSSTAVLILGLLIVVISLVMLVIAGKQVISVDPHRKLVEIQNICRFGTTRRSIAFSQISDVSVGELAAPDDGRIFYHVVLKLKNGKEVALFPGAFAGVYERQVMGARRCRLNDYLQTHHG